MQLLAHGVIRPATLMSRSFSDRIPRETAAPHPHRIYWLIVAFLLWGGYKGDVAIDKASTTPVTPHAYGVAAGIWWVVVRFRPKAA